MTQAIETHTLKIERLVYGGDALGRLDSGEVVFVPGALPGETVQITIEASYGKVKRGKLLQVISPSPQRVEPQCPVFKTCGGCQWQHLEALAQQDWKSQIVAESFRRLGKFSEPPMAALVPSPESYGYRNRVTWDIVHTPTGVFLAYHQEGSHQEVPGVPCLLVSAQVNQLAQALVPVLAPFKGLSRLQILESPQKERLVVLMGTMSVTERTQNWETLLPWADWGVVGVSLLTERTQTVLWGQGALTFKVLQKPFQVSAGSFFQVNTPVAEALAQSVLDQVPQGTNHLVDLYSGVGLFGLLASPKVGQVTLVESEGSATDDAQANLEAQALQNVSVLEGDVGDFIEQADQTFEIAIVDPPRKGVSPPVRTWLAQNITQKILYVSCDPTTLARDVRFLVDNGWHLDQITPFEMFPQTYHVETLAVLSRLEE